MEISPLENSVTMIKIFFLNVFFFLSLSLKTEAVHRCLLPLPVCLQRSSRSTVTDVIGEGRKITPLEATIKEGVLWLEEVGMPQRALTCQRPRENGVSIGRGPFDPPHPPPPTPFPSQLRAIVQVPNAGASVKEC